MNSTLKIAHFIPNLTPSLVVLSSLFIKRDRLRKIFVCPLFISEMSLKFSPMEIGGGVFTILKNRLRKIVHCVDNISSSLTALSSIIQYFSVLKSHAHDGRESNETLLVSLHLKVTLRSSNMGG